MTPLRRSFIISALAIASQGSFCRADALEIELQSDTFRQGDVVQVILKEPRAASHPGGTSAEGLSGDAGGARDSSSTGGAMESSASNATDGAALPVVQFHNKNYKVFPVSSSGSNPEMKVGRALIGINALLPPGSYKIQVADKERTIKIEAGNFGVQSLRLPKSKDNFNSSPGEEDSVNKAKATVSPRQYWEGKFLKPSPARTSSGFGLRRRVNGKLLSDYFHSGLDFAGAAGSPVTACQKGKVIISHWGWKLHGNTVCIDHGQGVVSFYIHLSKILVKEGDFVNAGQKIGLIGSTGRASGPHLHFSIYVNGDSSNPWNWFRNIY